MDTLFWYSVILDPTKDAAEKGARSEIIIKPDSMLARDEQEVRLKVARMIPEETIKEEANRLRIAVVPF